MKPELKIENAFLHNLNHISLSLPKNKLVVFTGLSGSGKSTLVFDTIHKEGQRQYMESLGLVTDHLSKPSVERIEGLSPTISVGQHLNNRSPRSTVGTATEIFTYLRVLFARIGERPCPKCNHSIPPSFEWMSGEIFDEDKTISGKSIICPRCGTELAELGMANLSFNKPEGACPTCTGIGTVMTAKIDKLIDMNKRMTELGAVYGWDIHYIKRNLQVFTAAARHFGFSFNPEMHIKDYPKEVMDLLLYGVESDHFKAHFPDAETPTAAHRGRFEGVVTNLMRRYAEHAHDAEYREKLEEFLSTDTCHDCQGTRLNQTARSVVINGTNIVSLSEMSLANLYDWIDWLPELLDVNKMQIAEPVILDLRERIRRLLDVGVGYLSLNRSTPTLSGGEAQRLRLASVLGSGLTGVIYVLDEPTIGLHPRDSEQLIKSLKRIRDLGNTVLVIEHDPDVLMSADYLVDIGPGAGKNGGTVIAQGTPDELLAHPESLTGRYLMNVNNERQKDTKTRINGKTLAILGAEEHNLKAIDISIPLGCLVTVTGVSGSGKSSLIFDILDKAAQSHFYGMDGPIGKHREISGWQHLDKVITIDQKGIGRIPRSNAATYTESFTFIREIFSNLPEARAKRFNPGHFSFNTPGGRCERCKGSGNLVIKMHFLPDTEVTCPVCQGKRYKQDVIDIKYRGTSIADVLKMTIEEAAVLFKDEASVFERLSLLEEVGLGYLQLGQPATTLSGGEAQRVKLAKELSKKATGKTLFLLDEPSTGLHMADTEKLIGLLKRLVAQGNTVLVVEHNLDIIAESDWVIDLGPDGGDAGGYLVAEGTPHKIIDLPDSFTGRYLRSKFL